MMESIENPIAKKLVAHFGGRPETGRAMHKSSETIRLWLLNGIPLSSAIEVEELSGGAVTAEEILRDAKRGQAPSGEAHSEVRT